MQKPIYINGKGLSSAIGDGSGEYKVPEVETEWFQAQKPQFLKYFDPKTARRSSGVLKMGMVAAFDAIQNIEAPIEAIIVGTGLGCVQDSEKFLVSLIKHKEKLLSPTPFIQSTHNTLAASIALQLKVHNYNFTYSERIFSFEWALLDAYMQIQESASSNILVGAADALTPKTFILSKNISLYQAYSKQQSNILTKKNKCPFAGDVAAFFALSGNKSLINQSKLQFVRMYFKKEKIVILKDIKEQLQQRFFSKIDSILIGINGVASFDDVYNTVLDNIESQNVGYYKHLCGESFSSSAFAFFLALDVLKNKRMPQDVIIKSNGLDIENCLMLNHFGADYFSATFISND